MEENRSRTCTSIHRCLCVDVCSGEIKKSWKSLPCVDDHPSSCVTIGIFFVMNEDVAPFFFVCVNGTGLYFMPSPQLMAIVC